MDLICLNRNAFLIPTPGQTEQEYLADYLSRKGLFNSCKQKDFTFDKVIIPETKIKDCFKGMDLFTTYPLGSVNLSGLLKQ